MKFIILAFLLCAGLQAQTKSVEREVMASFYPLAITVLNIADGVPGVRLTTLAPQSAGCLHDYQLNPADMKKLAHASVFVVNGGGTEIFLEKALKKFPGLIIEAGKGIEFMAHNEEVDEHVWLSITNVIQQSRTIAEALSIWDTAHKTQYMRNFENYSIKLEALKKEINEILAPFKGREIVTFHRAFFYFAREFGINIAGVLETYPGIAPDPRTLANLITLMKTKGVKAVFTEPQYPPQFAQTLARQTGAQVYSLDTVVSGKLEKDAYLSAMRVNAKVLVTAFSVEGKK